jgi:uncharacterized OsmC-like protein
MVMNNSSAIKTAFERSTRALSLKPVLGKGTGISKARITNGLTCEVEEGNWKLVADMPESVGGNAAGPTPGVYGRAALGSCLAIGYSLYAAKLNIPFSKLEVEIQADYDDGALFGTSAAPPGYIEIRYIVSIESDAGENEILHMLEEAEKHSPYLDVFTRAQHCIREIRINSPQTSQ